MAVFQQPDISIGVCSCLLGERVRYDGGHKHDRYISEDLGKIFRLVSVCPEVGCGMPIPREPMRLEGDPAHPRLVTISTRLDKTEQMLAYCRKKVKELEKEDLCGFIFKKGSPSCGLLPVRVYTDEIPAENGRGLFAAKVVLFFPSLPVEEAESLTERDRREDFIQRVLDHRRWKDSLKASPP